MALRIARPVLALPVRLIGRFLVDPGSCRSSTSEVGVDVRNENDYSSSGHVYCLRRGECMLCGDTVEPNGRPSEADLTMDCLTVGCTVHSS